MSVFVGGFYAVPKLCVLTARFRNHNSRQNQDMPRPALPRPQRRGPIEAGRPGRPETTNVGPFDRSRSPWYGCRQALRLARLRPIWYNRTPVVGDRVSV